MKGKVVLITGCSSGFGNLTAKLLAQSNYRVYAGVRRAKDLSVFQNLPKGQSPKTILLDVTWSQSKIDKVIGEIMKKEKKINTLVNNAGFGFLGTSGLFTDQEIRDQFETNFFGLFKVTKAVLPYMRKQKSGTVINVSSTAGIITTAGYGIYSSSKFALEALTQAMRVEESLFNIRVVALNPGSFETNFWINQKFPKKEGESADSPLWRLSKRIKELTNSRPARRGNPNVVSQKIKEIIENQNPQRNYLIGWDAQFLYWGQRLLPNRFIDWAVKSVVRKLA